jgi:hypothetical protein
MSRQPTREASTAPPLFAFPIEQRRRDCVRERPGPTRSYAEDASRLKTQCRAAAYLGRALVAGDVDNAAPNVVVDDVAAELESTPRVPRTSTTRRARN